MSEAHRKIGLALGGGGARGLAHIGVLKVLEAEGIPIHYIAGTSMGGIIGAFYAAGLSMEQIEASAHRTGRLREILRLIDLRLSTQGALKGMRIRKRLAKDLGEELTFADLRIPLTLMATDLISGREIMLSEGNVVEAVRATLSVPAVFIPVQTDNLRLADGGVLNNVPADVVRRMGAEVVIAVDVLPDFSRNQPGEAPEVKPIKPVGMPRAYGELWHVLFIMISAMTNQRLAEARPEVLIRPALPADMDIFTSFDRPNVAIQAGEEATRAMLERLREVVFN